MAKRLLQICKGMASMIDARTEEKGIPRCRVPMITTGLCSLSDFNNCSLCPSTGTFLLCSVSGSECEFHVVATRMMIIE